MGAAARLFEEFAKTNKAFELKAAAFDGKLYQGAEVSVIANLPKPRESTYYACKRSSSSYFEIGPLTYSASRSKTSQKLLKLKLKHTSFNTHLELISWL